MDFPLYLHLKLDHPRLILMIQTLFAYVLEVTNESESKLQNKNKLPV